MMLRHPKVVYEIFLSQTLNHVISQWHKTKSKKVKVYVRSLLGLLNGWFIHIENVRRWRPRVVVCVFLIFLVYIFVTIRGRRVNAKYNLWRISFRTKLVLLSSILVFIYMTAQMFIHSCRWPIFVFLRPC